MGGGASKKAPAPDSPPKPEEPAPPKPAAPQKPAAITIDVDNSFDVSIELVGLARCQNVRIPPNVLLGEATVEDLDEILRHRLWLPANMLIDFSYCIGEARMRMLKYERLKSLLPPGCTRGSPWRIGYALHQDGLAHLKAWKPRAPKRSRSSAEAEALPKRSRVVWDC